MEKAAANAEEGARRRTPSSLTRRSLLICCSLSHAAAFNSPAILSPPRQTPLSARAALSHLRGAPHSALPNEAGGGEAAAPCPRKGGAARRAAASVKQSAPINTPPIYESADCGVLPRISGNRAWRKPRQTPRRGQGGERRAPSRGVRF